jgi:hypothetical protein
MDLAEGSLLFETGDDPVIWASPAPGKARDRIVLDLLEHSFDTLEHVHS